MANIQIGTANGSTLGNPPSGDFYIFIDSNNSDSYTLRNSSGTDTILGGGSSGVSSVTGTTPIVSSGGTTPAISISAATTSVAGSLSASDKTKLDSLGAYIKAEVLITSGSVSGSASDQAVPSLTYTVATAGDYVVYAMISVDIDNSDMKPMSLMVFKNGVKENYSETMDFAKKNENQSIQLTYAMDGLAASDVIAIYVNNDNEDITTIHHGRILMQSWKQ